jgi:uncharacterized protein (TIGR00369 family)
VTFDREGVRRALEVSFARVPYTSELGVTIVEVGPGMAMFCMPYSENIVGDPATGIIHGGAITALLDGVCGAAAMMKLPTPINIATLDLRIDYLRPATPRREVFARAECYRLTKSIAFVRAFAFHDEGDPISAAAATFMLATKGEAVVNPGLP